MKGSFADKDTPYGLAIAVADGRQAVSVVLEHAANWGVASDRIGLTGFYLGAFAALGVAMDHDEASRPDFVAAIYGGEIGDRPIPADAPPLFAVVAQNDHLGLAGLEQQLYADWTAAKLPAELHIFASGGHGFGTPKQRLPVDHWFDLFGR